MVAVFIVLYYTETPMTATIITGVFKSTITENQLPSKVSKFILGM